MFTIKVICSRTGRPVKDKKVAIGFSGFRGMSDSIYTDSEGEAHFDNDPGKGRIYVDGKQMYEGNIHGRVIMYIN